MMLLISSMDANKVRNLTISITDLVLQGLGEY